MAEILIIDDDEAMCQMISELVRRLGHRPSCSLKLQAGLKKALAISYDVVVLDVRMPDGNGLEVLPQINAVPVPPEVVIITGYGSVEGAQLAMRNDAWDYLEKPFSIEALQLTLSRALQYHRQKKACSRPSERADCLCEGIVGSSPQIRACVDLVSLTAGSETRVLITGETGTGKDLVAMAIHRYSSRAHRELVVLDCAALPETLAESLIFGHKRGAFTGADRDCLGIIEQADGSTLFLDEIGELPLGVQSSLLRVLQERRFRPVGSTEERSSDFRLIAATNRNLPEMVKSGRFRADLLFRLQTITIQLPPLRERLQDIQELSRLKIAELCGSYGKPPKELDDKLFDDLGAYDWPGNVRELFNVLERTFITARDEPVIFSRHLPADLRAQIALRTVSNGSPCDPELQPASGAGCPSYCDYRRKVLDEAIQSYLVELFSITKGDLKEACRISGLSLSRLYELIKKHNVLRPR